MCWRNSTKERKIHSFAIYFDTFILKLSNCVSVTNEFIYNKYIPFHQNYLVLNMWLAIQLLNVIIFKICYDWQLKQSLDDTSPNGRKYKAFMAYRSEYCYSAVGGSQVIEFVLIENNCLVWQSCPFYEFEIADSYSGYTCIVVTSVWIWH